MAIIRDIFCTVCSQSKEVMCSVGSYPSICDECRERQENEARQNHLADRAAMRIEERLALVEAEMYDQAHAPKPFDLYTPIG